jgi:eukaryotic-like serine/threonine-protein kinase
LGKGAMGVVYKSFDPDIRRAVALKTIRKELLSDESEAAALGARFQHEAQAAGRLLHPGIVAVYEYGEDAQYAFIAMEYVQGSSLRQYFDHGIRFEERDLVSIMVQLLEALQFAHDQGVWHRDIKPANIIIMKNGHVKVADFGIARIESSTLTRVGAVMGTPGFIAPEQYLGTEVDHRVDIFAAGVVFYELLTGQPPFSGSREGVMYKVCHEDASPPSVVTGKQWLARFDVIAQRALAKRPQERYRSAEEFRSDLLDAHDQPVSPNVSEETLMRDTRAMVDRGEPPSSRGGAALGWKVEEFETIERSLIDFLGPIARVVVRDAAREAKDFASLVKILGDHLASADRAKFLQQNHRLAMTGTSPSRTHRVVDNDATVVPGADNVRPLGGVGPTAEEIERATRLLVNYLGPIAQILVREAARTGTSRDAFLANLADRLTGAEKDRFLDEFPGFK